MTLFTFLAAAVVDPDAVGPIETIARQFGVDVWKLLSQIISFTIVCFVLTKYAYEPILQVLEERRNKIAQGLKDAAEQKKQLAEAQVQAQKIISDANESAGRMIDEARAAAKSLQERETQRATIEAEQIVTKARDAAAREKTKMLAELKKEVARLVIDTTSKVSGKVLNAGDQKRLTEEVANEIAA
jgi:F-type H+-transporting ATPase subunit b